MSEVYSFDEFVESLARLLKTEPDALVLSDLSQFPSYDSLAKIEVAMLVEDMLGEQISQGQLDLCRTARDIFDCGTGA